MEVFSHTSHGNCKCYIIGNWTGFSFLKMFHLSSKRLLQFLLTGEGLQTFSPCVEYPNRLNMSSALTFSCRQQIRILSVSMMPSPHPLTSSLCLPISWQGSSEWVGDFGHSPTVSLYTVRKLYAHAPSLLLCFWWISSTTYRPGTWTMVFWVLNSGSVWTQIFLKWCRGRQRKKDRYGTCGLGLTLQTFQISLNCFQTI